MSAAAQRLRRLREQIALRGATEIEQASGRVGAVLALFAQRDDDLEVVLTRRRDDLPTHPGQVSFAGGRREPGESTTQAAVREAYEEIGVRPDSVEVIGHLPPFFIPPSRFWLAPVVARWTAPHPLQPQESEVAAIVHVPLAHLLDRDRWRKVRLSNTGWSLAWQLDGGHVLWGATAVVMGVLLDMVAPDWRADTDPADLADDREIMPWLDPALARRVRPALLAGVEARDRAGVAPPSGTTPAARDIADAGAAVAAAVRHLRALPDNVVVLAGAGGNGAVGVAAANILRSGGVRVTLVRSEVARPPRDENGQPFDGTLPDADLYIDALVGGGLRGRLRGVALDMLVALRTREGLIMSLDLPSGMHPTAGLVGDTMAASVTLALDGVWPSLRHPGLTPFVGDLYLWQRARTDVVRLVSGPPRTAVTAGGGRLTGGHDPTGQRP